MAPGFSKGPDHKSETEEERKQRLEPLITNRMREREGWDAFWKIFDYESRGRPFKRFQYKFWRFMDTPITFWREKIVEPLNDKYGHWPYYHRRFKRVPTIDECHVNDKVCYHEAQMQYRLDKMVDDKIVEILRDRRNECMTFHNQNWLKCMHQMEDFEEAELNLYIKYGELGLKGDVLGCYMKQKHRMIWERRNPHVMAERQRLYDEHKKLLNMGIYDHYFWRRGAVFNYKDYRGTEFRMQTIIPYSLAVKDGDTVSLDPEYYKKRREDDGKTKLATPFDIVN